MSERLSMIGVRVEPAFRADIKAEAEARFGGNESLMAREAMKLYISLRRRLGVEFEPTVAGILAPDRERAA